MHGAAGEYDSEETGTEESGSDISEDESLPPLDEVGSDDDAAGTQSSAEKSLVKKQK